MEPILERDVFMQWPLMSTPVHKLYVFIMFTNLVISRLVRSAQKLIEINVCEICQFLVVFTCLPKSCEPCGCFGGFTDTTPLGLILSLPRLSVLKRIMPSHLQCSL